MIRLNDITIEYNNITVLDSVNINFEQGHIYGLLGANGAGKSTLLACLGNIILPNSGKITYNGKDIVDNLTYIKEMILLNNDFYIGAFSTNSLMHNIEINKGLKIDSSYYKYLLSKFNINPKTILSRLSKGNQRLAYFAIILSLNLKVIILDEFIDGIDIVHRKLIKEELLSYSNDKDAIIIIASHTTTDINDLCDHIILLSNNKIQRDCSIDDLKTQYVSYQLVLKDNLNIDDLRLLGLTIYQYRSFENIRWLTIDNTIEQIELLKKIKTIDIIQTKINLEEVIFNEFSL